MSEVWRKAVWVNGKKRVTGVWLYNWSSDTFWIMLDSRDRITGRKRAFLVDGEKPEWGNWKRLVEENHD